jgi:hypothetical protein
MPKALGEFGKARNSDVVHKIMQLFETTYKPLTLKDIWQHVVQDLDRRSELAEILSNLVSAEKIQVVHGGFLPKKKIVVEVTNDVLDYSLLTDEELGK